MARFLPRLFNFVRAKGLLGETPVALDSRYRMLDYEGVTAATPNEPEVEESLRIKIGDDREKLFEVGASPDPADETQSLVITRGGDGMVAFEKKKAPLVIPIHGHNQVVGCHRRRGHGDCNLHRSPGGGCGRRLGGQAGKLRRRASW